MVPKSPPDPADPATAEARSFEARVKTLLGRDPTPSELAEFVRVRDALELGDNDALWLVLLALQQVRREIEASIDQRLQQAEKTADALLETARARFLERFPTDLKRMAARVTGRAMGTRGPVLITGLIVGGVLLMVGFTGVGFLAYTLGERAGYDRGVLAQQAEIASKPPDPPVNRR